MEEFNFRKNKMDSMISSYKNRTNRQNNKSRIIELDDDDLSNLDYKLEDVDSSKPDNLTISLSKVGSHELTNPQDVTKQEASNKTASNEATEGKEHSKEGDEGENSALTVEDDEGETTEGKEHSKEGDEGENSEEESDSSQSIEVGNQKEARRDSPPESVKAETQEAPDANELYSKVLPIKSNEQEPSLENNPNDFKISEIEAIENFVFQPIFTSSVKFQCQIKRDNSSLERSMYPVFVLYHENTNGRKHFLLAARKRKKTVKSNYIVSVDPIGLYKNQSSYIGEIKSNLICSKFTFVDSNGLELIAVYYDYSVFGLGGPRKIKVKIPKIMDKKDNPTKIEHFVSKAPMWDDAFNSYILDFQGRVKLASIKNFQLTRPNKNEDIILQFGKVDENTFSLDFVHPFSPVQAFCIAVSCFASKVSR